MWLLKSVIVWSAIAGVLIFLGIQKLQETYHHRGPGWVSYGDGQRSPEFESVEDESTYKRQHYVGGVIVLGTGLFMWYGVAKSLRDDEKNTTPKDGASQE